MTIEQLVAESRQLPRQQLAELLDLLTFELHEEIDPAIEAAWADEAGRRLAEIKSGQAKAIPGEQVMAELRRVAGR